MSLPEGAELGTTTDPKALIKGEPSQVGANATRLSTESTRISGLADDIDAISIPGWSGGYGEPAYAASRSAEQDKWSAYADLLKQASTSLSTYAGALTTAQSKAADAIAKWQQGEDATKQAVSDYNASVDAYNSYVNRQVCVPSYGGGPTTPSIGPGKPGPFVDPGQALRDEAEKILEDARTALDSAGATCVEELGGLEGAKTEGKTDPLLRRRLRRGPQHRLGRLEGHLRQGPDEGQGRQVRQRRVPRARSRSTSARSRATPTSGGPRAPWRTTGAASKVTADGSVTVLGAEGSATAHIGDDGLVIGADGKLVLVGAEGSVGAEWEHASVGADGQVFVGASGEGELLVGPTGAHANGEALRRSQGRGLRPGRGRRRGRRGRGRGLGRCRHRWRRRLRLSRTASSRSAAPVAPPWVSAARSADTSPSTRARSSTPVATSSAGSETSSHDQHAAHPGALRPAERPVGAGAPGVPRCRERRLPRRTPGRRAATSTPTLSIAGDWRTDDATLEQIADESLAVLRGQGATEVELVKRREIESDHAPAITQALGAVAVYDGRTWTCARPRWCRASSTCTTRTSGWW